MIGSVSGNISDKSDGCFLIDIQGIGYRVQVPLNVNDSFSVLDPVTLLTYLYVREDALILYGFLEKEQLLLFELLIGVSGIGPKMALSIVSSHSVVEIMGAVSNARAEVFQSVSGIGKKNAQRIIVDLQSKIGAIEELDIQGDSAVEDLRDALIGLGYEKTSVTDVLSNRDKTLPQEQQLKNALKELGSI